MENEREGISCRVGVDVELEPGAEGEERDALRRRHNAHANAARPTATVVITVLPVVSITETLKEPLFGT